MTGRRWVADPSIGWRILLTAKLPSAPDPVELTTSLARLYAENGWPDPPPVTTAPAADALRAALVGAAPEPVLLGAAGDRLVVSAHHRHVDGLGLLEVLAGCGVGPAASDARGLATARGATEQPPRGLAAGIASRLAEAALRPPLRPATDRPTAASGGAGGSGAGGEVMVERDLAGRRRTSALVDAAARAIVAWQEERGARSDHLAIAVGATRLVRPPGTPLADDSALLRLRDVEHTDLAGVQAAIRDARPEASPHVSGGLAAHVMAGGLRLLAPRLGSTLLVSHLGEVTAPGVRRLAFHPVTAGGSGLALGAVGHQGRTTLTLRARAAAWNADGLERLLEAIVTRL